MLIFQDIDLIYSYLIIRENIFLLSLRSLRLCGWSLKTR
ncbi:hypothetical protein GXM_01928 [Nostoc sphaeroides CCNUC1]|uniref:Uncharacterized protein n=1 Tax=Nostoc sphaeroides CCNUC1 TaxID=2653204 RepID=A0A5P8VVK8_9NOSO|nr:hypothetical protein GXM_01928 [Nostoc sphaeroides CCNUC1]